MILKIFIWLIRIELKVKLLLAKFVDMVEVLVLLE